MRRGCSCAIMVLRCWRAVLVLGGALLRCRAAVLRCRWARGASGGAGVVGFAGFGAAVGPRGVLPGCGMRARPIGGRSEEHTSELQSLMRISYAVFCLK